MRMVRAARWAVGVLVGTSALLAAASVAPIAAASMDTVNLGTATVHGVSQTVLTNSAGMTLYYLKGSTPAKVGCTGACVKFWPPLLLKTGSPTGPAKIAKQLAVATTADGRQVLFRGHPLFTFAGDKKPGQATGEGLKGVWFVASLKTGTLKDPGKKSTGGGGGW
jgi:predicted lipoprotein with Yx(FWY)xxD motif